MLSRLLPRWRDAYINMMSVFADMFLMEQKHHLQLDGTMSTRIAFATESFQKMNY